MSDPICPCGRTIVKDQFCAETPDQFAKRYNTQRCRAKCARLYPPLPKDRPIPPLSPVSWHTERTEGVAVEKQKTPRDRVFLQFLLSLPCELRGGKHGPCFGDAVYHHTSGGGVALKGSDYEAICVCFGHHELFDNASKKGIGIFTEQELKRIIARNQMEYVSEWHKIKKGGE